MQVWLELTAETDGRVGLFNMDNIQYILPTRSGKGSFLKFANTGESVQILETYSEVHARLRCALGDTRS